MTAKRWVKTNVTNLLWNDSSKKYFARVVVTGPNGPRQRWKSLETALLSVAKLRLADTEKELRAAASTQIKCVDASIPESAKNDQILVGYWIDRLFAEFETERIKPSTRSRLGVAKKALLATWPELPMKDVRRLSVAECQLWARRALNGGTGLKSPGTKAPHQTMSASSLNKAADVLRRALDLAKKGGLVYQNSAEAVERLPVKKKKLELPTRGQFQAIAIAIGNAGARQSKDASFLVRFLAASGMRLAEAGAVQWSDVDFTRSQMRVPGTKSETSDRVIPLFPALVELLKAVPEAERTGAICRVNECERALSHACEKVGCKRITHHDLRHLFATTCIESGVDIPTVSRWLGHSDGGALAMRTYGHLRSEHSDRMAQLVRL